MRLFEFEGNEFLQRYGTPVPSGKVIHSLNELSIERPSVLKAQIPAGGRKKSGGISFVMNQEEAIVCVLH